MYRTTMYPTMHRVVYPTMHRLLYLAMLASLATALGCRGNDDDTGGDDVDAAPPPMVDAGPDIDAPPPPPGCEDDSAIQDVQNVSMPVDTGVALCGVVVTAIDTYGDSQNVMFVQEPDGGEFSGMMLYFGTMGSAPAGIAVGDLVDVTGGVKSEFAFNNDTSGRTMTQIVAADGGTITVDKVGDGTVPDPEVVDAVQLIADDNEAERWEGVLVQLNDVAVVHGIGGTGDRYHVNVTGPIELEGRMTDALEPLAQDECLTSVIGPMAYFRNYEVYPRSPADVITGGSNCPAPEATATCMDGMDNDYDGFLDCLDYGCQQSEPMCVSDTSVVQIQDGSIAEGMQVMLTNVIVTGLSNDREHLWIMDNAPAGPNNGVYVYMGGDAMPQPPEVDIGTVLNVSGRIFEYQTYTEIVDPMLTKAGATITPIAVTGVDTGTLGNDASNEPYEGVLVELNNVSVTAVDLDMFSSFNVDDGSGELRVGTWSFGYTAPTQGECFASLVGVIHRFSSGVSFSPRNAEDMVPGGTCN